jgi:predicted DCC family thiol-disulfide oxidoreductase YuxK
MSTAGVPETKPVLLYDADCGFCKWSLNLVLRWDRDERVRPAPIESPEGERLLADMPREKRLESWHLVLPSGEVRSAGNAAAPLARLLPGGRPLAALFERAPGLTNRAYFLIARNRGRLAKLLRIDPDHPVRR